MKRALLILLVLLSAEPASAEWMPVGGKVEEGWTVYTIYVDSDTISRNGNVVRMWALMDFQRVQTEPAPPHLSVKSERELDCTKAHVRLLSLTAFSGNMGSGHAVYSYSDSSDQGISIEPGSVAQRLWKVVCLKE